MRHVSGPVARPNRSQKSCYIYRSGDQHRVRIPDFEVLAASGTNSNPSIFRTSWILRNAPRDMAAQNRNRQNDKSSGTEPRPRAVEKLVRDGKCSAVITQNIDGLHQASGVPDERVIELHGNSTYATCLDCGERHDWRRSWHRLSGMKHYQPVRTAVVRM